MVPGLYIEKGWVHESIDYSYTLPPEEKPAEQEEEEEDDGERCVPQSDIGYIADLLVLVAYLLVIIFTRLGSCGVI